MDKNYCRLCLKQDTWNSPLSVFADYEILSKIFLVHGIKILESDSFSKVICHLCLAKLEFMDGVRKKVAISNSILNGIVQTGESRLSTETQTVPQLDGEQQATELCCDKCEFSTNTTSLLLAHVELHNSVATRSCPRCPATVLTEDSLALHLKRKHKNRTLAIHYCPQCAKLVYGNEQFSKHCQQHAPDGAPQSRTTKKKHKRDKVKAKPVTETPRERIVLKISKTASNDDDQVSSDNNNPKPAVNNNSVTSVKDNAHSNRNHSQTSVNSIKDSVKDDAQTNRNYFQTSVTSVKDSVKDDARTNRNNFQTSVTSIKDSVKDDARTNKNYFQTSVNSIKGHNSVTSIKDNSQTNENNFQTSVNSIKGHNSVTSVKDNAQTNKNNFQTSGNSIKGHNFVTSIKDSAQTNKNHFQTSVNSIKDSVKDDAQTNKNNFQTSVNSIKGHNSVTSIKDNAQTNKNNFQTSVTSIKDSVKDNAQTNKNNFQTSVTNIKVDSQTNKYNFQTLVSTKLQTPTINKENVVQTTGRSEASQTTPAKKRRMSGAECSDLVKESNFMAVDGPECFAAKKDVSVDKEGSFVKMKKKIEEARRKTVAKTSDQFGSADDSMCFDLIDSDLESDEIYSKQDNDKWMSDTNRNRLESSLLSSVHNHSQGWRQSVTDNKAGQLLLMSSVHKQSHVVGAQQSLSDDKVGQEMDSDIQVAVDGWDPGSATQRIYIDVDEDDDVIDCGFRTSSGDSCGSFASLEIEDVIEIKDEYLSD